MEANKAFRDANAASNSSSKPSPTLSGSKRNRNDDDDMDVDYDDYYGTSYLLTTSEKEMLQRMIDPNQDLSPVPQRVVFNGAPNGVGAQECFAALKRKNDESFRLAMIAKSEVDHLLVNCKTRYDQDKATSEASTKACVDFKTDHEDAMNRFNALNEQQMQLEREQINIRNEREMIIQMKKMYMEMYPGLLGSNKENEG